MSSATFLLGRKSQSEEQFEAEAKGYNDRERFAVVEIEFVEVRFGNPPVAAEVESGGSAGGERGQGPGARDLDRWIICRQVMKPNEWMRLPVALQSEITNI